MILFDEIEEFCLNRENESLGMKSRLLTTALLTKFNDLRKEEKSIFFLATNRLKSLDSAIIRPGRFDMQLFVGTPNLSSRLSRFESMLEASEVIDLPRRKQAMAAFEGAVRSRWNSDVQYFNFLESEVLGRNCVAAASSAGKMPLTEDAIKSLIDSQRLLITIRGSDAREEYESNKSRSRW